METVRLLALDSFGTLFDVRRGLASAMRTAGIVHPEEQAAAWIAGLHRQLRLVNEKDDFHPFMNLAATALDELRRDNGLDLHGAAREQLLAAWKELPAFPDVKPALETWRSLGAPAWIVTNGDLDLLQAVLDHNGLAGLFNGAVSAAAVQKYKPAPEVYLHAATAAGALPSQMVMASALPFDASGAEAAGFRAALIRREGEVAAEEPAPHWIVENLEQLVEVLQPFLPRPELGQQVF